MRDFRPIVREGINRLGQPTWPSGTSVWSAEAEGRDLTVDQVEVAEVDVPEHVKTLLAWIRPQGRCYSAAGMSSTASLSCCPLLAPCHHRLGHPHRAALDGPDSIYARLAELGHAPARFREDLRSRMPLPDEAERLQIAAGTPVVEICRVALDANGLPVEVHEMTADSSASIFRYEFST